MNSEFLQFILIDLVKIFLLVNIILLSGKLTLFLLGKHYRNKFLHSLLELVYGLILVVSIFSFIKAGVKTINVILVIFIIYSLLIIPADPLKNKRMISWKGYFRTIFFIFTPFLLFLLIQLFRFEFFTANHIRLGFLDYSFYSDVSENFLINGIERIPNWYNSFSGQLFSYSTNPGPYHFFDLWLHSLVLYFSGLKGSFAFVLLSIPLTCSFVSYAFYCLIKSYAHKIKLLNSDTFSLPISILLTFSIGSFLLFRIGYNETPFIYPKLFITYILMIVTLLLIFDNLILEALLYILLLPLFNIICLPFSVGTCLLLCLYLLFIKNEKGISLRLLLSTVILLLLLFLFYYIIFPSSKESLSLVDNHFWSNFPKSTYTLFRGYLAPVWIYYLPLVFSILILLYEHLVIKKKQLNNLIILLFCSGLTISYLLTAYMQHVDSFQFVSNLVNPLATIISVLLIIQLFPFNNWIKKLVLLLFFVQLGLSFYYYVFNEKSKYFAGVAYSNSFLSQIKHDFKVSNKLGCYIKPVSAYSALFSLNPNISRFSAIFDVQDNGFMQVSLSIPFNDTIPLEIREHAYVKASPFYKYHQALTKKGIHLSDDDLRLSFVKYFKLEYLVLEPGAVLPVNFKPLIKDSFHDDDSGVTVITLSNSLLNLMVIP